MSKIKLSLISLFAIFFICSCGTSTTTPTTTTSTTTTTVAGCYIGAYVNGLSNTPAFETLIGKNLAVNMWYINWSTSFPTANCNTVNSYGGVPMITWEPFLSTSNTLEAIVNGNYDSYITSFAQDALSWGNLLYLRFGHEMNGNWYSWDGYNNGGQTNGPANYIAAWKHIHDIFTSVGATNVRWVWSPNCESTPNESWNAAANYYPGHNYVDWIALDGYNWGNGDWKSFDQVFSTIYSTFESYGKPLMIAEFASAENGGSKDVWIADAFSEIENNYPLIRMFVWFNINKERDWRVESSTASSNAFNAALQDSYFLPTAPTN